KTAHQMSLPEMQQFFNRYLPQDIVVNKIEEVPERFHARYHAKGKQYSYYVWSNAIPSVFARNTSFHCPQPLDLEKMQQAAEKLIGTHDFIGFSALKKSKKSTVRTIDEITITPEGDLLRFTFKGNGFLHKMVRILTGTLIAIGDGTLPPEVIDQVLAEKVRQAAGETVPSHGLFLDEVYY
ncbi:MAG: tRNA pseudouridine synthase A, partial [Enterococcus sp.]